MPCLVRCVVIDADPGQWPSVAAAVIGWGYSAGTHNLHKHKRIRLNNTPLSSVCWEFVSSKTTSAATLTAKYFLPGLHHTVLRTNCNRGPYSAFPCSAFTERLGWWMIHFSTLNCMQCGSWSATCTPLIGPLHFLPLTPVFVFRALGFQDDNMLYFTNNLNHSHCHAPFSHALRYFSTSNVRWVGRSLCFLNRLMQFMTCM